MSEKLTPTGVYNNVTVDETIWIQPSKTYKLDYETDGQVRGYCEDLRAVEQAIYKILNTERYKFLIYSWNYGIELADLFGKPIPYVYAEIQRRIIEALLADDRIIEVSGFEFSNSGGDVFVTFDAVTRYGVLRGLRKEVSGIV
ncbi:MULTISPECIES: DUF2634 domain-containing protein [Megasphaera]|uniref:PF10934 family protein n=1 Tax=Megasphaera vaginalis (ex Srinivasan et al. 2021) TaxID=1111454 RepID=U7UP94_9FIRM|nr:MULTISPECIES: DUF2634 domain-containing protein [Megasphaera]ERT61262.1 PF10934 family protein [Megasphaera vaginalis (ex Srinivasan et al. 2021)]